MIERRQENIVKYFFRCGYASRKSLEVVSVLLITQEPLIINRVATRVTDAGYEGSNTVQDDGSVWQGGSRGRGQVGDTSLHYVVLNLLDLEIPEDAVGYDGEQRGASQHPAHRYWHHLIPVNAVLAMLGCPGRELHSIIWRTLQRITLKYKITHLS